MVACVPFSSILRERNARAIALTMALSMWRGTGAVLTFVPSGARTSVRPPAYSSCRQPNGDDFACFRFGIALAVGHLRERRALRPRLYPFPDCAVIQPAVVGEAD
jgi:hypothetical protein